MLSRETVSYKDRRRLFFLIRTGLVQNKTKFTTNYESFSIDTSNYLDALGVNVYTHLQVLFRMLLLYCDIYSTPTIKYCTHSVISI